MVGSRQAMGRVRRDARSGVKRKEVKFIPRGLRMFVWLQRSKIYNRISVWFDSRCYGMGDEREEGRAHKLLLERNTRQRLDQLPDEIR